MKQQEIIDNMREHCTNLALCEKFSNVCNELAERRALKRKLSKSNLKSSVSKFNQMNKEKAIELIKEVKDSLFLTKGLYMGKDEHLITYIDLNMQRCAQAIKELEG